MYDKIFKFAASIGVCQFAGIIGSLFTPLSSMTVSFVLKVVVARPLDEDENNFFILSIRAIAKSILGPVTIHIWEPDSALSLKQSQAMNRSINSDMPKPVAFLIQRYLEELVLPLGVTKESKIVFS